MRPLERGVSLEASKSLKILLRRQIGLLVTFMLIKSMTPLMPPLRNNPILVIAATLLLCWSLCLIFIPFVHSDEANQDQPFILTPKAKELHLRALVIDGHNDLPWQMRMEAHSSFEEVDIGQSVPEFHTDIPRLKRGGPLPGYLCIRIKSG